MNPFRYLLPILLGCLLPITTQAQRLVEFPALPDTPVDLAIGIAAGFNHAVMATDVGTVVAWGSNNVGQTNVPTGLTDVVQVSANVGYSLALRSDGTVVKWGSSDSPNPPSGLTDVIQVAAGEGIGVALHSDGTVTQWGAPYDPPVALTNVIQVAVGGGEGHVLALRSDGTVIGWGSGTQVTPPGDLTDVVDIAVGNNFFLAVRSNGAVVQWGSGPTPPDLADVIRVAASDSHALALRSNGTVVGWGSFNPPPDGLSDVVDIAAGFFFSVALRSDGTVIGWGPDWVDAVNVPSQLPFSSLIQTAGGNGHTVGLLDDGTVIGWGNNGSGQASPPDGLTGVVQVAAGGFHSLALRFDGTVVSWGSDTSGDVPADLTGVVQVAAGTDFSLALRSDGTVVAWGNNDFGQTSVPVGLTDVVQVAAGFGHAVAVRSNGTVAAWGWFEDGQTSVPVGLSDVIQVAAGSTHSVALRSNGTVVAWGNNSSGQTSVPSGLTDVVYVAAGANFSLALLSDGTFEVWGSVPPGQPAGANDDLILTSAGFSHITLLKRLPGEPSPYLHIQAEAQASNFPLGSLAFVDLFFEDGDGLPVIGSALVQAFVYDFSNNLIHVETVTLHEGEPWTFLIPEGYPVPIFNALIRAQHPDYLHSVHDGVQIIGATGGPTVPLSVGSKDEGAGWRMLSSPMVGSPVQRLALANLVQGIPGEYEGADTNLYVGYDGNNNSGDPNRGFVVPTGLSHHLMPGKGFIWYLWDEDAEPNHNSPGESESYELPVTVSFVGTSPLVETHSVTFHPSDRSSVNDDGFYLIGNPYGQAYPVSGIVPNSGSWSGVYHHWDSVEDAYVLLSSFEGGVAEPGQGFFMQFGHQPTLPVTITFGPPLPGPPGAPDRSFAEQFSAHFELTGDLLVEYQGSHIPVEIGDRNARVIFSEDATDGFDFLDAGKLTPLSYYWANIALMGMQESEMVRRSIESRPLQLDGQPVAIPMALSTSTLYNLPAGGEFTISLVGNELGDGWQVILHDLETGDTVNMLTGSYTFTIETQPAIEADERFEIVFTPPTVSDEGSGEAYVFGMESIWPNPTISGVRVAFTLETAGEINLEVFDVLGRRVVQMANGEYAAGRHVLPMNTNTLASGVYVVRLTAGSQTAVQRVTVAR